VAVEGQAANTHRRCSRCRAEDAPRAAEAAVCSRSTQACVQRADVQSRPQLADGLLHLPSKDVPCRHNDEQSCAQARSVGAQAPAAA